MVKTLKDLSKLISLCHKQGVESIKIGDIELKLGVVPSKHTTTKIKSNTTNNYSASTITEDTHILSDGPTAEQLLMWSVSDTSSGESYESI